MRDLDGLPPRKGGQSAERRPVLLAEWRAETIPIILHARHGQVLNPVILVLCDSNGSDPIAASALGADEVINWLDNPLLLEARLLARFRRLRTDLPANLLKNVQNENLDSRPTEAAFIKFGDLELSPGEFKAHVDGRDLRLTPREYDLLAFLVAGHGECQSADILLRQVWCIEFDVVTNRVEVAISGLRHKLKAVGLPEAIRTVRGRGYILRDEAAASLGQSEGDVIGA